MVYMNHVTQPIHSYILQICDMVAIARYLNVTLIVPELDRTSFWADPRHVIVVFSCMLCSLWEIFQPFLGIDCFGPRSL